MLFLYFCVYQASELSGSIAHDFAEKRWSTSGLFFFCFFSSPHRLLFSLSSLLSSSIFLFGHIYLHDYALVAIDASATKGRCDSITTAYKKYFSPSKKKSNHSK